MRPVPGNIVVVEGRRGSATTDVTVGFDERQRYLEIAPRPSWSVGSMYWLGVRGYERGVRAVSGLPVVSSLVYYLLKREQSLTCGAETAAAVDPACPTFVLMSGSMEAGAAATTLVQLELIRQTFIRLGAWEVVGGVGGLPKGEAAIMWGFPTHSASVAELNPKAGLGPRPTGRQEIRLAVNGPVDAATVKAFSVGNPGTVVVMDLTAAAAGDLGAGLPPVDASYEGGDIVIRARSPFAAGHLHGIMLTRAITDHQGRALVPSPVSVLLAARGKLVNDAGKSNVSTVSDADAKELEAGRAQLAALLDDPLLGALTGVKREDLVFLYAFPFPTL